MVPGPLDDIEGDRDVLRAPQLAERHVVGERRQDAPDVLALAGVVRDDDPEHAHVKVEEDEGAGVAAGIHLVAHLAVLDGLGRLALLGHVVKPPCLNTRGRWP